MRSGRSEGCLDDWGKATELSNGIFFQSWMPDINFSFPVFLANSWSHQKPDTHTYASQFENNGRRERRASTSSIVIPLIFECFHHEWNFMCWLLDTVYRRHFCDGWMTRVASVVVWDNCVIYLLVRQECTGGGGRGGWEEKKKMVLRLLLLPPISWDFTFGRDSAGMPNRCYRYIEMIVARYVQA